MSEEGTAWGFADDREAVRRKMTDDERRRWFGHTACTPAIPQELLELEQHMGFDWVDFEDPDYDDEYLDDDDDLWYDEDRVAS